MTFRQWLDNKKWRFKEARMIPEWNELDQLADSANTAQLGSGVAFGTIDFATNCNPDVVPVTGAAGQTASITGGVAIQRDPKDAQFR